MSEQAVARKPRKVREGLVVSDKMDKTVVVEVEDRVKHALYGKVMRRTSRLKAHDENNVPAAVWRARQSCVLPIGRRCLSSCAGH